MISREVRPTSYARSFKKDAAAVLLTAAISSAGAGAVKAQEIDLVPKIPVEVCHGINVFGGVEAQGNSVPTDISTIKSFQGDRVLFITGSLPDRGLNLSVETAFVHSPKNTGTRLNALRSVSLNQQIIGLASTQIPVMPTDQIPGLFMDGLIPNCVNTMAPETIFLSPLESNRITQPGGNAVETFKNILQDLAPNQ